MDNVESKYMSTLNEASPSNRKFGLTIGTICVLLYLFSPIRFTNISVGCLGLVLILAALFVPVVLTIPNKAWMKLGDQLHQFTNPIFMLLLYVIVFCPVGLLLKLFSQFTKTEIDNNTMSYWIKKEKCNKTHSMKNQF